MVVEHGSWDASFNDYVEKLVQGLKNWEKKGEQIKKDISKQKQEWAEKKAYAEFQRKRMLKKLKKLRKNQRKKVVKIRRRTWITFRDFVMTFGRKIVTLETLDIESQTYNHANLFSISHEKTFVPRNTKKKKLNLCIGCK